MEISEVHRDGDYTFSVLYVYGIHGGVGSAKFRPKENAKRSTSRQYVTIYLYLYLTCCRVCRG